MIRTSAPSYIRCLILGCVLLLAGCKDAPTAPQALRLLAGGEAWVAVPAPHDLPKLDTWLPYVDRSSPQGADVLSRIQDLSHRSTRARQAGRLAEAAALSREAERMAVLSLTRMPEPQVLRASMFSLGRWSDRVRGTGSSTRSPELEAALRQVETARNRTLEHLASGDTAAAIFAMSAAAERIREFTPEAVALRVLVRVEQRLRAESLPVATRDRALHLLSSARQELTGGDPLRALRRALYALQLADGNEMRKKTDSQPECVAAGCTS